MKADTPWQPLCAVHSIERLAVMHTTFSWGEAGCVWVGVWVCVGGCLYRYISRSWGPNPGIECQHQTDSDSFYSFPVHSACIPLTGWLRKHLLCSKVKREESLHLAHYQFKRTMVPKQIYSQHDRKNLLSGATNETQRLLYSFLNLLNLVIPGKVISLHT